MGPLGPPIVTLDTSPGVGVGGCGCGCVWVCMCVCMCMCMCMCVCVCVCVAYVSRNYGKISCLSPPCGSSVRAPPGPVPVGEQQVGRGVSVVVLIDLNGLAVLRFDKPPSPPPAAK